MVTLCRRITQLRLLKITYLGLVMIVPSLATKAQFYNLPSENSFSLLTEKKLAARDSSLHTGIKPYIPFFSDKYKYVPDTHRIFKYIYDDPALDVVFYKHLIRVEPRNAGFKLRLDPLLNFEAGRDVADSVKRNLYTNTRGFIGSGSIGDKFYFETMLAENQSIFPGYISRNNKATGVVPGQGRWKPFKVSGFDYAFSSGFISIQPWKHMNIQAGHGKQKIGHGYRSLLLSDNAFNYPYARVTTQFFKGRVQYSNIYAVLMNLVPASVFPTPNTERMFQKKPAAFQYLSLNITKSLNIGLFQGIIWQAGDNKNRQKLSWQYFNPLIFSNLVTYGLENRNNVLAGADLKLKLTGKINLYAQIMADDLNTTDSAGTGTGYQAGLNLYDCFGIKNLFMQVEYNSAGGSSYRDQQISSSDQSYSHYSQNLAFTPGSGNELVVISDYKIKRFFIRGRYNYQTITTGYKSYSYCSITDVRFGYLINPSYNMNISLGLNSRTQNFSNFKPLNNKTSYISLSFKTGLYNLYYDF